MNKVDWTKPLEAYLPNGRVEPVTRNTAYTCGYAIKEDCVGAWDCFNEDGSNVNPDHSLWKVRNRPEPAAAVETNPETATLRDQFAMTALTNMTGDYTDPSEVSAEAYAIADAMLEARKKGN